jgi:hypothetical protein
MCNQVRGFHLGVRKFIAKIRMTFSNCADINLCMYSFIFPSQTELKVHRTSQYICPTQIQSHRTFCQTVL